MSISISNSSSMVYSSMAARSTQSKVTLSGASDDIAAATSGKEKSKTANMTGKLNALEHSASASTNPSFLRGVISKVADVKVRNVDIEQMDLTQSSFEFGSVGLGIQDDGTTQTYSAEQMQVAGQNMSYQAQGTVQTKSGAELGFSVELSSSKIAATYAAASYQTSSEAAQAPAVESAPASQLDVAA